jgi:SAM-dependent methyltransferase
MGNTYRDDFERFLRYTDEKQVLLRKISEWMEHYGARSLLDIGAGSGELSIPIANRVTRYRGIESRAEYVAALRAAGLDVTQGRFPIDVDDTFDVVLASHSVSYDPTQCERFVHAAWRCTKPGGALLIVTYRGQDDDWTALMHQVGFDVADRNRVGYNFLVRLLFSLGDVKIRKVVTRVRTPTLAGMVMALTFVAGDGNPERTRAFREKWRRVERILSAAYRSDDGFAFPFQHFLISVTHRAQR